MLRGKHTNLGQADGPCLEGGELPGRRQGSGENQREIPKP